MSEKTMTPEALMDLWRRVNPGKVCVPPSLYVLDFARAVLREYCNGSVTEREAVLRERKAFIIGAECHMHVDGPRAAAEIRYPLPVRRRPTRVTLSDGSVWSKDQGRLTRHYFNTENTPDTTQPDWSMRWLRGHTTTADDFRQIARMLDGETEEVPEGEE